MSWRTRDAIAELGVERSMHRSHQLTDFDVDSADVVICLAAEHVAYMRRTHTDAVAKTVTLKRLVRDLAGTPDRRSPNVSPHCALPTPSSRPGRTSRTPPAATCRSSRASARTEISDLIDQLMPELEASAAPDEEIA